MKPLIQKCKEEHNSTKFPNLTSCKERFDTTDQLLALFYYQERNKNYAAVLLHFSLKKKIQIPDDINAHKSPPVEYERFSGSLSHVLAW